MTKQKEEYRYQFLKFDYIPSGKFENVPYLLGGLGGMGLAQKVKSGTRKVPINKEVAVVFDKKTGKIKYQDYEKNRK